MPTVNVQENIKQISSSIEKQTQEIFRLQGMLSAFEGFRQGGLINIELPNDPTQMEELESVQEKPE